MKLVELAEKYSVDPMELESFILQSDLNFKKTFRSMVVFEDPQTVIDQFNDYLEKKAIKQALEEQEEATEKATEKEEKNKKEKEFINATDGFYINEEYANLIEKLRAKVKARAEKEVIYKIKGARGRSITIYPYKCVINTDATAGSIISGNATDGEKTIYFKDCIGIQYKRPGMTLGYIQFETAGSLMNNSKSNFFNENTFTFEALTETMDEVYEFLIGAIEEEKNIP